MSESNKSKMLILSSDEMENTIQRIALEVLEGSDAERLALVGIHTRGLTFRDRVEAILRSKGREPERGDLDITLYRDDLDQLGALPEVKASDIPFVVEGARIVLFDDVLFTGRTIRSAINVLMDYGRPARIELAVLIDRGNRELPICPDYTGRLVKTLPGEHVSVRFNENDGSEGVDHLGASKESRK